MSARFTITTTNDDPAQDLEAQADIQHVANMVKGQLSVELNIDGGEPATPDVLAAEVAQGDTSAEDAAAKQAEIAAAAAVDAQAALDTQAAVDAANPNEAASTQAAV